MSRRARKKPQKPENRYGIKVFLYFVECSLLVNLLQNVYNHHDDVLAILDEEKDVIDRMVIVGHGKNKTVIYKINKNTGGPSRYYNSIKLKNNIGFISPLSNNFCSDCNRVRITSTGKLFMCLGQNEFVDFKDILRNDYSNDFIKEKIRLALNIKPKKHNFIIDKNIKPYMSRHMNVTGG